MAKKKPSRARTRRSRSVPGRKRTKTGRQSRRSARKTPRRAARPAGKAARKAATRRGRPARKAAAPRKPQARPAAGRLARLERERRRLPEADRLDAARDLGGDRMVEAARSGQRGLKAELERHTQTSPALTAGDVDARWDDAYAVGDESPGGDNPTPDQDRVDDIGKALGVQYQDNEELKGGDEIVERDQKRWELDPASSEDWPHKE